MRSTWFVDGPARKLLVLDPDVDVIHVQAGQPGWPGWMETPIPWDLWHEVEKDLIDIHPRLGTALKLPKPRDEALLYTLNANWQSVTNLLFMLGASGMFPHRSEIISAWRQQPLSRRKVSWLQNCGDPSMAAAQLLATVDSFDGRSS